MICQNEDEGEDKDESSSLLSDCTLAYVRALTAPPLVPPSANELKDALVEPWDHHHQRGLKLPIVVDTTDSITNVHWKGQPQDTDLCQRLLDFRSCANADNNNGNETNTKLLQVMTLQPYLSLGGDPTSPFFAPQDDVVHCLKHLLLHQIGSSHSYSACDNSDSTVLVSHDLPVFVATGPNFRHDATRPGHFYRDVVECIVQPSTTEHGQDDEDEDDEKENSNACTTTTRKQSNNNGYILRCHYETTNNRTQILVFGYHLLVIHDPETTETFHRVCELSLKEDPDWRLKTSIILTNMARIINCLKDYTIPLKQWYSNGKLSLIQHQGEKGETTKSECVQKVYTSPTICGIFGATVESMIRIYQTLQDANVPHTDRLLSVDHHHQHGATNSTSTTICQFGPIGRCYLPINAQELLDALGCVVETLLAMHYSLSPPIMHRDIRWANVFHAMDYSSSSTSKPFTREWVLFDFEFAATVPQPAFGEHTLTPGNHAPEMIRFNDDHDDDDDGNNNNNNNNQQQPQPQDHHHGTAVDVWGLGYLIANAHVDMPISHKSELLQLQDQCMQTDPAARPSTRECYDSIKQLQSKPLSREKDVFVAKE